MAERRKGRKKKDQVEVSPTDKTPSKDEYAIAKYMREKLPEKKTSLLGHRVDYFIASKAIDCLLDSPWATKSEKHQLLFTNRDSVADYLDRMLQHKFFHRARVIVIQKEEKKKKKGKDDEEQVAEPVKEREKEKSKEKKSKDVEKEKLKEKDEKEENEKEPDVEQTEKKKEKEKEDEEVTGKSKEAKKAKSKGSAEEKTKGSEKDEDKKERDATEKKKDKKKKIKLDMHLEQIFLDGSEVYVWIYDPIPMRTWVIGMLMVLAAVLICLFPLWPQIIRHYIYYLSIALALFLVFIIGLAIIRLIAFVIIWALTLGRHHLWLLPNLTADVGFFESFWPLYEYEYKGPKKESTSSSDKGKEKDSTTKEKDAEKTSKDKEDADKSDSSSGQEEEEEGKKEGDQDDNSDSEHDSEQESEEDKSKAENADNGFEILEKNEVEEIPKQSSKK